MRFVHVCAGILMLVLAVVIGVVGYETITLLTNVNQESTKISAGVEKTLDNLNRDCGNKDSQGNSLPCGTLANINKATVNINHIAESTQLQVAQTNKVINSSADALTSVASHLNGEVDALQVTTKAATEFLNQGTTTLQTANAGLTPVLTHADSTIADFDILIRNPSITDTFNNIDHLSLAAAGTTQNVQDMTLDGKKVADDLTNKYFTPEPWYKKIMPGVELGIKAGDKLLGVF